MINPIPPQVPADKPDFERTKLAKFIIEQYCPPVAKDYSKEPNLMRVSLHFFIYSFLSFSCTACYPPFWKELTAGRLSCKPLQNLDPKLVWAFQGIEAEQKNNSSHHPSPSGSLHFSWWCSSHQKLLSISSSVVTFDSDSIYFCALPLIIPLLP